MSTPKFKVGDRVRRTSDPYNTLSVGTEDVVAELRQPNSLHGGQIRLKEDNSWYFADLFELVSSQKSELEELVRKANEGAKAEQLLRQKYLDKVEANVTFKGEKFDDKWEPLSDEIGLMLFRVKPKPAFTPFTVGDGWKVELKGAQLHIGCKYFDARDFKDALKRLCELEATVTDCFTYVLFARRHYISDECDNRVTWEDADKILKALEEAGV